MGVIIIMVGMFIILYATCSMEVERFAKKDNAGVILFGIGIFTALTGTAVSIFIK